MQPLRAALTLAGLAAAQAWLGRRSARAYGGLPRLTLEPPAQPAPGHPPSVSIVVPARNEAANLPRLLPSLLAQEYPHVEVLVVDDGSTDGTAAVARTLGTRVLTAGPLPPGWAGKPHACAAGAAATHGAWLLFTDADTWHAPGSLRAALAHAVANDLEALSLFPAQQCVTPWEQMLLPYAYQHFFAGVNPAAVNDPSRPDLLLNGQYLLIRRDAYDRAGAHAAVRNSVIEDMAFAAVLKRAGIRYQVARGEALVSVRMYAGLRAIIAGFAKNSLRFAAQDPRRAALVIGSTLLSAAPTFHLLRALLRGRPRRTAAALPSYLIAVAALLPWQRSFGSPRALALAQPLTALLFQIISFAAMLSTLPGQTRWKGRRY